MVHGFLVERCEPLSFLQSMKKSCQALFSPGPHSALNGMGFNGKSRGGGHRQALGLNPASRSLLASQWQTQGWTQPGSQPKPLLLPASREFIREDVDRFPSCSSPASAVSLTHRAWDADSDGGRDGWKNRGMNG